jgi:hypothetical protein
MLMARCSNHPNVVKFVGVSLVAVVVDVVVVDDDDDDDDDVCCCCMF